MPARSNRRRRSRSGRFTARSFGAACALAFVSLAGCSTRSAGVTSDDRSPADRPDTRGAPNIESDPTGYLQSVAERCARLDQYTLTLTRCERRGLFNSIHGPERIACWFRRRPFSVRFRWLDVDVKHGESTYVEGRHGNKVRFVPRRGLFGLPPSIVTVDPRTPVIWGETRYPVTDFGLERLMQQTLESLDRAGDLARVTYAGTTRLPELDEPLHYLRLEYPPAAFPNPIVELYIAPADDLPVAAIIRNQRGELQASYVYADVNTNVSLTDASFLLDVERDATAAAP
jgi:hypothetical protein